MNQRLARPDVMHVLITMPRSGTHWLKAMISAYLGLPPIGQRLSDDTGALLHALSQASTSHLCNEHFFFAKHGQYLDPALWDLPVKMVQLYRHPLDHWISQYYRLYFHDQHELPQPGYSAWDYIQRMLASQGSAPQGSGGRYNVYNYVVAWLERGWALPVRYEDLVADTPGQLARVVAHYGAPVDMARIKAITSQATFSVFSQGRKPGQEDKAHHYRKGVPGEWREVVPPDSAAWVQECLGDFLAIMGYPPITEAIAA